MKILYLGLLLFVVACSQSEPEQLDAMADPYSETCPAGQYGVGDGCEPLRACETDADCEYLLKETLPPRTGSCEAGTCKAYCGSGIVRVCTH